MALNLTWKTNNYLNAPFKNCSNPGSMSKALLKNKYLLLCCALVTLTGLGLFFSKRESSFSAPESVLHNGAYRFNYRAEEAEKPEGDWEDRAHGAQLGFNWRQAQAAEYVAISERFYGAVQARSNTYGPFAATWHERGPGKIPGRVTASEVLHTQNLIYLLTDGGYIFKGTLNGNDWQCLNDHHPAGRGVDARMEIITLPNGGRRIIAGGWDGQNLGPKYLQYSDDEGQTWQTPSGLPDAAWFRRTLADDKGNVYHMVLHWVGGQPKMGIFQSKDYGQTFAPRYNHNLAEGYHDRQCDMWLPPDSDTLFTVFEDQFVKLAPDGSAALGPKISNKAVPEWAILTGGRTNANAPYTFYLRIWDGTENGIYRSTDGGNNWQYWGALVEGGLIWPFSNYAFATNPADPSKVYAGGWILGASADGSNWHYPHDLGGYVGYHGDVPDINFVKNPATNSYELYIGTDGGYYKYQPQNDQFASLSVNTLGNTQIYKMASSHSEEYRMYIGTQDNGFNFNATPTTPEEIAPFSYLWGGDVTQLVSGDGGKSFWCFWIGGGGNYVQDAAKMTQSGISNGGPLYDVGYWEMPAAVDPLAPDECLVAGYRPEDENVSYLSRLKAAKNIPDGSVIPFSVEYGNYDFKAASGGAAIGAIGVSPLNNQHIYVMTENGVFFWSLDKGQSWQKNESAKNKIYPRYIKASPANPGEVFVGGAAYDGNSPCWRIGSHGASMTPSESPAVSVLKNNRVNALCYDPEGKYVFAAADIGAFVYVLSEGKWHFIGGKPAPVSAFHDVEYLEQSNTVRFATYSRGVWDFKIESLISSVKTPVASLDIKVYPNPCTDFCMLDIAGGSQGQVWVSLYNTLGACVYRGAHPGDAPIRIPMVGLAAGTYQVVAESRSGQRGQLKLLKL